MKCRQAALHRKWLKLDTDPPLAFAFRGPSTLAA